MDSAATDIPRISVVIPTCNRREPLARCLESLSRQTYPNYEVIVVDDASDDGTADMLEEFAGQFPNVALRRLRNDRHSGANVSRNRGARESSGSIIAFIDSDCIAEPDWIEKIAAGFAAPNVAAVTGLAADPPSSNIYELVLRGVTRVHGDGEAVRLVGCNMAVRKDRLLALHFDEDPRWKSPRSGSVVTSPVCDEESIFLRLRAEGWSQRVLPQAIVLHDHHYDRRAFFRHAWSGGRGAAYLVYKYRLGPRLDLFPLLLAYLAIPLTAMDRRLGWICAAFFLIEAAALLYNEKFRKGKTWGQMVVGFPLVILYYHVRLVGYCYEAVKLRFSGGRTERIRLTSP